jgi:hypothetical protein
MALKAFEDELAVNRNELFSICEEYIVSGSLPKTIEVLRKRYQWARYEDVRNDFELLEKILRDIYIAKMELDKKLINADITDKVKLIARSAPDAEVMQRWFTALAKASRVHRVNNVSADIAFIGAFIEFDRARKKFA